MTTPDVTETRPLIGSLWWLVLLRGVLAIVLGVLAFVWPVATVVAFAWVFAAYTIADGVTTIMHAVSWRKHDPAWGWMLVTGALGIVTGAVIMIWPLAAGAVALLVLLWIVAIWAIASGAAGIPAAASLASGAGKTLAIVFSVLSLLFGVLLAILLFATPGSALVGLVYVLGSYAVLSGLVLVLIAFQVRAVTRAAAPSAG